MKLEICVRIIYILILNAKHLYIYILSKYKENINQKKSLEHFLTTIKYLALIIARLYLKKFIFYYRNIST